MADLLENVDTVALPEIAQDTSESWVQLLPSGKFDLVDKRGPWVVKDMAAIIAASQAAVLRGMPVDMDHALDRHNETEAPAAGWIEELAAREDGIWARIAWTPTGKAKITGREYRFISPVVMVTKAGRVMAVTRAGLTNAPAIAMKAICAAEPDAPEGESGATESDADAVLKMLREAMGTPADMPVADLIRRARAILDAAGRTKSDSAPAKELASSYMKLLAELHEDKTVAALDRARASGKLVPAMEGWAQELASQNLASFEAWEAAAVPLVNLGPRLLAGRTPQPFSAQNGRAQLNSERLAVCAQLGLDPSQVE